MSSNLQDPRHPWARLTAAARTVPDERDTAAPYGFATRVAALAFAHEETVVSLFDRFALRALGVASLLAIFSVAWNYRVLTAEPSSQPVTFASSEELVMPAYDPVAVVLDIAD